MRRGLLTALTALAAIAAGCGGDDGPPPEPDVPPQALLEQALGNPVESGEIAIDMSVELDDVSLLGSGAGVTLEGPFALQDAAVPLFDLEFEASVSGFGIDGELVSDGEDGYVVFFGENYRLGSDRIDEANAQIQQTAAGGGPGVDPVAWIADPQYDGTEEVDGTDCHRITGTLVPGAISADLRAVGDTAGLDSASALAERLRGGTAEVLVDEEGTFCGGTVDAQLAGPGQFYVEVRISEAGSEVEIKRPEGGGFQPIEELIAELESLSGVTIDF